MNNRIDVVFNSATVRDRLLSEDECDAAISWAEASGGWQPVRQPDVSYSVVGVDQTGDDHRIAWLLQKFRAITHRLNNHLWNFDISDIGSVGILRYDEGDRFGMHIDFGEGYLDRKISLVVQLSSPDAYTGGVLQFGIAPPATAARDRGSLLAFPAWVPHRVSPVVSGRRYVATCFVLGPPFR